RRLLRAAPAPTSACLYGVLQFCENPSISEQGCANAADYSGRWAHLCEPNSRRITSSVRLDLIYDRDKGQLRSFQKRQVDIGYSASSKLSFNVSFPFTNSLNDLDGRKVILV